MAWTPSDLSGASCMDPFVVFQSFNNLATCFSIFGLPEHTDGEGLTSSQKEGYHLSANSTFGNLIGDCLNQYCEVPDPELEGCDTLGRTPDGYYRVFIYPRQEFKTVTCDSVDNDVNDDIGGVGVLLSFAMQSAILLYVNFIVLILKFIPAVARCIRRCTKRARSKTKPQFGYHHFSVIKSMMVEFQEAQCFFMLSFQCAALIALAAGPQVFEATSLLQVASNISMAKSVALMGILPITYGLWVLHKIGLHSWYISAWSAITIVTSSVTLHLCKVEPRADNLQGIATSDRLDKCGFFPPPLIYCRSEIYRDSSFMNAFFFGLTDVFLSYSCIGIYGLLLMKRLAPYPKRWFSRRPWFQGTYHRVHPWLVSKGVRFLSGSLTVFIELFLLFYNFIYVATVVARSFPAISLDSWSFGQIIAVTIWAPIISKYLHWVLFGTDSYSAIRFPSPYKIIRVKSTNDEDQIEDEDRLFIHLPSTSDLTINPKSKKFIVTDVELTPVPDSKESLVSTRHS
ncbi:uncharacterized protein BDW43DRAFT_286411 [Aspergillus alliaceus]|uniref:uncharacterized protein n=1 Tax=Petromyces alliaceus TaxID=209559 RepID=UPI0012A4E593|nr:uncharacterized protein BDW43DRAFT_286411 [Aspergillus alliaceus]KAB8230184.1 hypothetical protein BDW43DRAFT_286411 [Aspergillus alliaceus]